MLWVSCLKPFHEGGMLRAPKALADDAPLHCFALQASSSRTVDPEAWKDSRTINARRARLDGSLRREMEPVQLRTLDAENDVFEDSRLLIVRALLMQVDGPAAVGNLGQQFGRTLSVVIGSGSGLPRMCILSTKPTVAHLARPHLLAFHLDAPCKGSPPWIILGTIKNTVPFP